MDIDPQHKKIRRFSLISSIVFLAVFGTFVLIGSLHDQGLRPLFDGPVFVVLLFVPLAVAVVFITRLVYLRLTVDTRIPFVDGWLIQLSILGLYTGPFIFSRLLTVIDAISVTL